MQILYLCHISVFHAKEEITAKTNENWFSHISGSTVNDANGTPTSELDTYAMLVLLIIRNYNVQ
jgi:hypothetical protein